MRKNQKDLRITNVIPCHRGEFPEDDEVFATSVDQVLLVRPEEGSNKISLKDLDQTQ